MATIQIIAGSFTPAVAAPALVGEHFAKLINGTVQVQYGAEVITAFATKYENGSISVFGFVGRYRTSNKPWRVSMSKYADGRFFVRFGRDERSGRNQQQNGISWEPATFYAA